MSKHQVVWTSTAAPGGISKYVEVMQQTPLWTNWNIRHIVTHREGSSAVKMFVFARGAALFLVELVRSRPKVVHLHTAGDASFVRKGLLLWTSQLASVPVVLHVHAGYFPEYYENSSRAMRAAIRFTLNRANAVVALGETWGARLRVIAPRARITVIPNAVQSDERVIEPGRDTSIRVAFLGRIGEHKGTFRLLDAWAQLSGIAATLTIAGDGEVERARNRVRELQLTETVEVRGWQSRDEVSELLASAQVLVLPSHSEGQPMAVLEAMARGLCIVASNVGGLPEMIGNGCGVLVDPYDISGIAAALRLVISDDELRARCGSAAHARFIERYDVRAVWPKLDALYQRLSQGINK
jgi:glycosyltransferase involved in cell wall biosynthesis